MELRPCEPVFRLDNKGLQVRTFELAGYAVAVSVPTGIGLNVYQLSYFRICDGECQRFSLQARRECRGGVGARLMNDQDRCGLAYR